MPALLMRLCTVQAGSHTDTEDSSVLSRYRAVGLDADSEPSFSGTSCG